MTETQPRTTVVAESQANSYSWRTATPRANLSILGAFWLLFAVIRWCKLEAFWGDASRWIFEVYRGSLGELPYRDFSWQYPPLSLFLFSGAMQVFGQTFLTLQVLLDLLSAAVLYLTWDIGRRLLPPPVPLLITLGLTCAGASNTSNFALFSLELYTPAMLVGMAGMLLLLREVVDYVILGEWSRASLVRASVGAFVGLLSKPEFIVGVGGCLLALALTDLQLHFKGRRVSEWLAQYVTLLAATIAPATLAYVILAVVCGPANLAAGIGGYGLAQLSCPWWPTGLGMFGGLVAVGQAAIIAAAVSLTKLREFRQTYGSRYWMLWGAAGLAGILTILYLPFCAAEIPVFGGKITITRTIAYFLSTGTVLLPVMWASNFILIALLARLIRSMKGKAHWTRRHSMTMILILSAALMSLRALFNGTMNELPLVSSAAYPVWFLLGPFLLIHFIHKGSGRSNPDALSLRESPIVVTLLLAGFALLRLGGALSGEWKTVYTHLSTPAGWISVKDQVVSRPTLEYVASHSAPGEYVLDLAFGGAIDFAVRRTSSVFTTQITAIAPSQKYLAMDVERIRQNPPRLVIANEGENFQASYGVCLNTGCMFPALVWRSSKLACVPDAKFPMLDYIRENYVPVAHFSEKVIYARR